VGVGLLGGQLLTLAGLAGSLPLLRVGALFTIAGWSIGMFWLARLMVRAPSKPGDSRPWHALSVLFGLAFGLVGLVVLPAAHRATRRAGGLRGPSSSAASRCCCLSTSPSATG
jgi:uncharacterized protein involved in response to NO